MPELSVELQEMPTEAEIEYVAFRFSILAPDGFDLNSFFPVHLVALKESDVSLPESFDSVIAAFVMKIQQIKTWGSCWQYGCAAVMLFSLLTFFTLFRTTKLHFFYVQVSALCLFVIAFISLFALHYFHKVFFSDYFFLLFFVLNFFSYMFLQEAMIAKINTVCKQCSVRQHYFELEVDYLPGSFHDLGLHYWFHTVVFTVNFFPQVLHGLVTNHIEVVRNDVAQSTNDIIPAAVFIDTAQT